MAVLNPNYQAIEYASNTKLMELADELASTRKSSKRDKILDQAAKIRYFLKAVGYKTTYLTNLQVNNIYECLVEASEINDFPVVPTLPTVTAPSINIGPKGDKGDQGDRGYDGGGTDFTQILVGSDTVIDSFLYTDSVAARWDFVIYDGTNQRTGWIQASWDGSSISSTGELGADEIGDTSGVVMSVDLFSGSTRLVATVTSGTWTITGSRYFIPNNGNFSPVYNTLASGRFYIGNASNIATGVTISGDATVSSSGVLTLTPLNIVNGDISGSAAIALTKLATLTASRSVVTDGSGVLTTSSVTSTELGYLSGVTSNIQTQIDAVSAGSLTGAISTVLNTDLSPSRAVISNVSGKIAVSAVTSTELGYISGVTSSVQTQITSKHPKIQFKNEGSNIGAAGSVTAVDFVGDGVSAAESAGTVTVTVPTGVVSVGVSLATKVVEIGDWDMDTNIAILVPHLMGSNYKKIRSVSVVIRDDNDQYYYPLNSAELASSVPEGGVQLFDSTNIYLRRRPTPGLFDSTTFNSTSYNRGWITITYEV